MKRSLALAFVALLCLGAAKPAVPVLKAGSDFPAFALQEIPEANFFKRLWHELLMWWES